MTQGGRYHKRPHPGRGSMVDEATRAEVINGSWDIIRAWLSDDATSLDERRELAKAIVLKDIGRMQHQDLGGDVELVIQGALGEPGK